MTIALPLCLTLGSKLAPARTLSPWHLPLTQLAAWDHTSQLQNNRPAIRAEDPDEFKREINKLVAGVPGHGGDGPEQCFAGLLLTAQQSNQGSPIFVFTDAWTKQGELYGAIKATVQQKRQRVFFIGISSETDPLYASLAEASGGRLISTSSNVGDILESTSSILNPESDSVLLVNAKDITELSKSMEFSVDPMLTKLEITVGHSSNAPTIQIFNPAGALVTVAPVSNSETLRKYQIEKPAVGKWRVQLTAKKAGWNVEIGGKSAFDIMNQLEYQADDVARFRGYVVLENNPLMSKFFSFSTRDIDEYNRFSF